MNKLIPEEVYIRLAEDSSGFVCTIKYGKFDTRVTEFALDGLPTADVADRKLVLARKSSFSRRATPAD